MIGAVPAYLNIHAAVGPTAAQRTALVTDLSKTPSLNQNLPHPTAGVAPTAAKPAATAVSAVKATAPATASSNTTVYIAAGVAALLVLGVVVVKAKAKKKKR
jgi:LPXTG cell wall anchor motif